MKLLQLPFFFDLGQKMLSFCVNVAFESFLAFFFYIMNCVLKVQSVCPDFTDEMN